MSRYSVGNPQVTSPAVMVLGLPALGNSPVSWSGSGLVSMGRVEPATVPVTNAAPGEDQGERCDEATE